MKHVHEFTAKGRVYRYFRHGKTKVRLHGEPDSPEFWRQYNELLATIAVKREPTAPGTVAALITDYKRSPEFQRLKPATRHGYAIDLDRLAIIGSGRVADVKRMHILTLRDELADRPRAADHFVQVAARLFNWAVDRGYIDASPLMKIGRLNRNPVSYRTWTEAECERFEQSQPREALMTRLCT